MIFIIKSMQKTVSVTKKIKREYLYNYHLSLKYLSASKKIPQTFSHHKPLPSSFRDNHFLYMHASLIITFSFANFSLYIENSVNSPVYLISFTEHCFQKISFTLLPIALVQFYCFIVLHCINIHNLLNF